MREFHVGRMAYRDKTGHLKEGLLVHFYVEFILFPNAAFASGE